MKPPSPPDRPGGTGSDRRPSSEPPSPSPARPGTPPPARPASPPVGRPDPPRPARPGTPASPGRRTPPRPARPSSPPSARPTAQPHERSGLPAPPASGSPPPPARLKPARRTPGPPAPAGGRPAGRGESPEEATLRSPSASTEWGFSDAEGTAWIARVAGTARSGVIADSGAALMVVRFFRAGDESEKPRGELLTVARDLAELFPDEWQALLAEATRKRPASVKGRRRRRSRLRRRR